MMIVRLRAVSGLLPLKSPIGARPIRRCIPSRLCSSIVVHDDEELSQEVNVLQMNVPTIYTSTPLEPYVELTQWVGKSRALFGLPKKFCTPADFNYKFPAQHVPEFAFVGRSNVGKSSLISKLLGDEKLVRTSKLPGCTRSVNFFAFVKGGKSHVVYMVDLPGYGFAKAAKTEKAKWKDFMEGYLRDRNQTVLRRVYLLVDSRHGMKMSDMEMMKLLDQCGLPYQIVLTKSDSSSAKEKTAALESCFKELMGRKTSSSMPFVHLISSRTGEGIDHLQYSMTEVFSHPWQQSESNSPNF